MSKRAKTKPTQPKPPMVEVAPNLTRPFPAFWKRVKQLAASPDCPPPFEELFVALFNGKTTLLEPMQAAVFLQLFEGLEGWDKEAVQRDYLACPVLFSMAADQVPHKGHLRDAPTNTAQVLDLRDGEVESLPLSGEVFGLCVPDTAGTLILSAPPGLPIEEIQRRMENMTGEISSATLFPVPMASLPDGSFFAVLLPGGNAEIVDSMNYVIYQLLGKNGHPPQPPRKLGEA